MALYTASQLAEGVLITDEITGETNFNFIFPSASYEESPTANPPGTGSGYFTFETLPNVNGGYSGVAPLAKGNKSVDANSKIVVKPTGSAYEPGFIWSAQCISGGTNALNVIEWTPATTVGVGTARLRATGGISVNVV